MQQILQNTSIENFYRERNNLTSIESELWQPIAKYPAYEISNLGNIRNSINNSLLAQSTNGGGYKYASVYYGGNSHYVTLHREVAEAFCPKPAGKDIVNHINGNKGDNRAANLEWLTQSENVKHGAANRSYQTPKKRQGSNKLSVQQADSIIAQALDLIDNKEFKPYFYNTLYKIGPSKFYEAMDFARKQNVNCQPCIFVKRLKLYRDTIQVNAKTS